MFGGSPVFVSSARRYVNDLLTETSGCSRALALCSMPQIRAWSKLARTRTGTVLRGTNTAPFGVCDVIGWPPMPLRQDQCLLLDVVVDLVDEHGQLGPPLAIAVSDRALVLKTA